MKAIFRIIIIWLLLSSSAYADNDAPKLTAKELRIVNSVIKSIENCNPKRSGGNACEAEGHRIYLAGPVGYRGRQCVAVQFAIEAGNADYQYLLVLERSTLKRYGPLRIGGRGYRQIEIKNITDGLILAEVMWYSPNDSLHVPSIPGMVSFALDFGGLVERGAIVGQ